MPAELVTDVGFSNGVMTDRLVCPQIPCRSSQRSAHWLVNVQLTLLHVNVNVVKTRYSVLSLRRGQIKDGYSGDVPKEKRGGVDSSSGTMNHPNLRAPLLLVLCHLDQ